MVVPKVFQSPSEATGSDEALERLASQRLAELTYRVLFEDDSTAAATPRDTDPVEPVGVDVG